jgi:hypothetical protein
VDDLWTLDHSVITGLDLKGYKVSAVDGEIGKVVVAHYAPGRSHVVVSTGRVFGRDLLVPAGLIDRIDVDAKSLHLSPAKAEIERLPDAAGDLDEAARARVESLVAGAAASPHES